MIQEKVKDFFKEIMVNKGYPFFERGDLNLNIIGVRSDVKEANSFDDWLFVIFKNRGVWQIKCFDITTDAGTYWLKNPSHKGTALLVPNCYRSVYKIDKHRGKYDALCQRGGKVAVYRDNNKNLILDNNDSSIEWGWFGINIHKSHKSGTLTDGKSVGRFSAGCQVFKSANEYKVFMNLVQASIKEGFANKFTYTLLTYKDFQL